MVKEIKEIGIIELFENVLNIPFEERLGMSFEQECKLVIDWAEENDYYVYSRGNDEFFKFEGFELAEKGGYKGVIFDNLS